MQINNLDYILTLSESEIETWVHAYLLQPAPAGNSELSSGLKRQKRYWYGPAKVPFHKITQRCGPDPSFAFYENPEHWHQITTNYKIRLLKGEIPPPFILEYTKSGLQLADGNHRFGAMQNISYTWFWSVIWYNSLAEYRRFLANRSDYCYGI